MIREVKHPQLHFFNHFEIAGTNRAVAQGEKKNLKSQSAPVLSAVLIVELSFFFGKKSLKNDFAPAL